MSIPFEYLYIGLVNTTIKFPWLGFENTSVSNLLCLRDSVYEPTLITRSPAPVTNH